MVKLMKREREMLCGKAHEEREREMLCGKAHEERERDVVW